MRCVDCLCWTHYAEHLRSECVAFWFPGPATVYDSSPGYWWDEDLVNSRRVHRPLRLEIEGQERQEQYQLRLWKAKKMVRLAKAGVHAARYHLTRLRREAVSAREVLVRRMFQAGRSVVDTGLALVALMDRQRVDAERTRWQQSRDEHRALRREWDARKKEVDRMYLGA